MEFFLLTGDFRHRRKGEEIFNRGENRRKN